MGRKLREHGATLSHLTIRSALPVSALGRSSAECRLRGIGILPSQTFDALDGGGHVDAVERRGMRAVLAHLTFVDVTLAGNADSQAVLALFSAGYAVAA